MGTEVNTQLINLGIVWFLGLSIWLGYWSWRNAQNYLEWVELNKRWQNNRATDVAELAASKVVDQEFTTRIRVAVDKELQAREADLVAREIKLENELYRWLEQGHNPEGTNV